MKKLKSFTLLFFVFLNTFSLGASPNDPYESMKNHPYTDHVSIFQQLFSQVPISSMIEFGLGVGTQFFLENVHEVSSVEIVCLDQNDSWYKTCLNSYANYTNWKPSIYKASKALTAANRIAITKKDPALIDASYLLELRNLAIDMSKNKPDLAFVDPGIHNRGDIVNCLFDLVDIIVAHDTNHPGNIYGWNKVYTPSNYQKIVFTSGQGTTFWVKKTRLDVIYALTQKTQVAQSKTNLRIFVPHMHSSFETMLAHSLEFLGHKILWPGSSFTPGLAQKGPGFKTNLQNSSQSYYDGLAKHLQKSVEIVEEQDIFNNPPDILLVTCPEVESEVISYYKKIKSIKKDIKIVHYSGNNYPASAYSKKYAKNRITLDSISQKYAQDNNIHHVVWIPWIEMSEQATNPSFTEINSYLGFHYTLDAFKKGKDIYNSFSSKFASSHSNIKFFNHSQLPHEALLHKMEESLATLHCKDSEGFGCTIVESLSKGRPVFLYRPFCQGFRLMNWCIEEKTAYFFETYEEFEEKMLSFLDKAKTKPVHQECLDTLHLLVNNEQQCRILQNFLDNLQ